MITSKNIFLVTTLLGAITVMLGAFGAHGLKPLLTADKLVIYEKAVFYQFIHLIPLFALGILGYVQPRLQGVDHPYYKIACYCFLLGILLFSGSLYMITGKNIFFPEVTLPVLITLITPLGGLLLIAGWLSFFIYIIRQKRRIPTP